MTSLDKSILAHMDVKGQRFEIVVDPDLAYMYKTGRKKELNNVLVVEEVFENFRKGERHKSGDLQKAFGTTDVFEIAKIIFEKGELQLTTDQKRKMTEEKRKQIIALIAREAIDPRTQAPIPVIRLENALEEVRLSIDPFKSAESQVEDVVAVLRPILPIKFERVKIAVRIPAEYASRAYGTVKMFNMIKEEWGSNGSFLCVVEIPAGMQGDFYDKVNKACAGQAETKILPR